MSVKKVLSGLLVLVVVVIVAVLVSMSLNTRSAAENGGISITEEPAQDLQGVVDVENSIIQYTGYGVGKSHVGQIPLSAESTVALDTAGVPTGATLVFDMANLTSDNNGLTNHLLGSDFFAVDQYPTAQYQVSQITDTPLDPTTSMIIEGELTLKGNTVPHNMVALYNAENGQLSLATSIDRTKWDVMFNSAKLGGELGNSLIEDSVDLNIIIDID
jgi:polyisoprenoid-binding protein YceI